MSVAPMVFCFAVLVLADFSFSLGFRFRFAAVYPHDGAKPEIKSINQSISGSNKSLQEPTMKSLAVSSRHHLVNDGLAYTFQDAILIIFICPFLSPCRVFAVAFLLFTGVGAHLKERPDHHTTRAPPRNQRAIHPTLRSKHVKQLVNTFTEDGLTSLGPASYRAGLRLLHRESASKAVAEYIPPLWPRTGIGTKCGNRPPSPKTPTISEEEKRLPRKTRCTLAQIRSGYSIFLNSYNHRIDPSSSEGCPDCGQVPHDSLHLFNCPKKPTSLAVDSLWTAPIDAAKFLGLDIEED